MNDHFSFVKNHVRIQKELKKTSRKEFKCIDEEEFIDDIVKVTRESRNLSEKI